MQADARDLRQASDNAVINEPPTAHELKHSEICAYLKVDMVMTTLLLFKQVFYS